MKRGGDLQSNTAAADHGDGFDLKRESSLLPGEVRTPTMIVTLSEAWGESSADWAAPGSSSVWEEDAPSRHSAQTPLRDYGHSDVWASATGSPLLGGTLGHQENFTHPEAECETAIPETAELAAATLQALAPDGLLNANPHGASVPLPQRQLMQPRYSAGVNYRYESRFGTVHQVPPKTEPAQFFPLVEQQKQQQQRQQQHRSQPQMSQQRHYFTVQEGSVASMVAPGALAPVSRGGKPTSSPGNHAPLHSSGGMSHMPRFEDEAVAHSIIASAGLPLSMHSLVEYIHNGQPPVQAHATELGTTQNALRNYPNLSESPAEEEPFNGRGGAVGHRGGHAQRGAYGNTSPTPWSVTTSSSVQGNEFSVRGHDSFGGYRQGQALAPSSNYGGGFTVSAHDGPLDPSKASAHHNCGGHGNGVVGSHKSESKYLSDLLHFHANFFPPPPPPRVPKEERRSRAELWYHYASKWDITHRLPPPPRTPLPEMELEYRMRLPQMTRVPYHGDGWLHMSERWFDITQQLFDFPDENMGIEVDLSIILRHAVLS
ncbi:hypothetical protein JKF63_03952 [Porcisia hertigi]|uniref:Uncharacterized protein n=1 Tax=Porcisia hertigi TaxID=2761500 RepID=A0A836HR90_9TRYP|nr:hypothetical protein JKF63_03952 [Porcisia hertigi]